MIPTRTIHILLVDDDPNHRFLIRKLLSKNSVRTEVTELEDGQQALDYMNRRGVYADTKKFPDPDFILLDIRMPGIDGLKVLKVIKEDEQTQQVPVVILTTSTLEEEVIQSYKDGANAFVTKPTSYENFAKTITALGKFWVSAVEFPPQTPSRKGREKVKAYH
jgi:CheY-like chemotaxis protein